MLHNLRYYQRRAEKRGRVRYERAAKENLDELFDALFRLHQARWSTRGEPGVLADPRVQQAHREALPGLLELGALRLYAMRLDDRIVASFYGFADPDRTGKRVYYYLGGFAPELEELSLGTLLIGHALREAIHDGAAAFDFLRGREGYKYLWGAQDQETYRRRLWHASDPQ
jgi:CelD/BcsL family acetyltransferase involved in cellulose biosynthesis